MKDFSANKVSEEQSSDEPRDSAADEASLSAAGLRIAIFSGNYNCVRDGSNRALNRLAQHLLDRGAAVRIYSPTTDTPAFEPVGDLVSIPSFAIPMRPEYRIAPRLTKAARDDIRRFNPTHFHLSAPDWLGTSAQAFAKELGVPMVVSHHTQFEKYLEYYRLTFLSGWMRRRIHRFYSAADALLAPNEPIAENFRHTIEGPKIGVWGRGVDRDVFTPTARNPDRRRELGYGDDEVVILFLGRIVAEKGLEVFASVMDELRERGYNIVPLVIGQGPALQSFKDRLDEARFTGHLEDADLGRAVANADILINPSATEAFGNVNLEAMASGLAIVSADVESAQVLIRDGESGLLVPPRDIEAYADAVERLIASPDERARLGAAAVEASKRFNWDGVLAEVVRAYREVARP